MLKLFDEVFEDRTKYGTKIKTDDYHSSGAHIIIDQGQEQIAGYTNLEEGLFTEVPAIIFGDHTRIIKYVDRPFFLGADGVKVLRCRYKDANYKYLYYALKSVHIPNTGYNRHFKWLKEATIFYPDRKTQAKIVETLEKASVIIKKRQQQLSALDDLIKARFVELFDDGESPLKTVEELCSDIVDCPHTTPKYTGELKNPAIRTSEIKKGYITWDSMRYVSDEEYEERVSRLRPKAGDIVYGREGTFGNAAILPEGYKFCLGQRVMLLRPDYTKCTSEYLLHAAISDDVYRQAVGKNNASTVAHVNVKDVKQFKIPLPSFDKQNQFSDFVKQVDKSKVAVQKALDEAQILFDGLMQQYFG
jgi:type I restriction enzyme S subunit